MSDLYLLIWAQSDETLSYFALPKHEVDLYWGLLKKVHGIHSPFSAEYLIVNDYLSPSLHGGWATLDGSRTRPIYVEGKWYQYRIEESQLPTMSFCGVYRGGLLKPC